MANSQTLRTGNTGSGVPNEELLALEDTAYLVLRLKGNGFQEQWAVPYIDAVEEEIRRRSIKP